MLTDEIRNKLQIIVRGEILEGQKDYCTTTRNHLIRSFGSDPTVKSEFGNRSIIKEKQARFLKSYAENNGLWLSHLPEGMDYLTKGGESAIFLGPDHRHVVKINDAVYYATWTEYLNSLTIHNILFSDTAYELIGFMDQESKLCAVVRQPFVIGQKAELEDIKKYLLSTGFQNTKRQDYYHTEFGIRLEDMHDENVIAKNDLLFFIDTVFYIM